jgi:L,D-peptidoglycan transpeptidase YkuD (ErfK/YbiS/YcfS/YnhG family)
MKMKVATIAAVVLLGMCALAAALGARTRALDPDRTCSAPDSRVFVDLKKHSLALCEKEKLVEVFNVRLGRGGIGKTQEGDGKTPSGTYALGEPRPSKRFGTFIPIGFPTEEQKKMGYSGSAVGVHGPPRWAQWLGSLVNTFDLSDGCVGVARDSEIERIANWVRTASAGTIELR